MKLTDNEIGSSQSFNTPWLSDGITCFPLHFLRAHRHRPPIVATGLKSLVLLLAFLVLILRLLG
jgi:hypothetical protein